MIDRFVTGLYLTVPKVARYCGMALTPKQGGGIPSHLSV